MLAIQRKTARILLIAGLTAAGAGIIYRTAKPSAPIAVKTAANRGKTVYVQTAPVTQGVIRETVSLSGTVISENSIDIVAQSSGLITALYANDGQYVKAGQVLAQLANQTQQAQVQIARGNLTIAQAKLQGVNRPPTQQSIAIAKDSIAVTQAKLQSLQSGPTPAQVNQAQTTLQNAQNNLSQLVQQQQFVNSADSPQSVAVQNAEAVLQQLQSGQSPVNVSVKTAQEAVQTLESGVTPQSIGVNNADSQLRGNTEGILQAALDNLLAVKSNNSTEGKAVAADQIQLSKDQSSGNAAAVSADETRLSKDQAAWAQAISQAESQLASTETNLYLNNAALAQSQEQQALQNALDALAQAQAQAAQALSNAQAAVQSAKANQANALQQLQSQVIQAQNAVSLAKTSLAALQAPPTATAIAQAQAQVDAAENQLAALEYPQNGPQIAQAQGGVQVAQGQLALAEANLAETTLRAPIDGILSQQYATKGTLMGAQKPVFTLDGKALEIQATLDQQQLGTIRPGDKVSFTLPSNPGKSESGTVYQVSPTADPQTLSFTVTILPKGPVPGMAAGETVSVQVVTQTVPNGLLIPTAAIQTNNGNAQVYVVKKGHAVLKNISTGAVQGDMTQVTSGLSSGDELVVMGQTFLAPGDKVAVASGTPGATGATKPSNGSQGS